MKRVIIILFLALLICTGSVAETPEVRTLYTFVGTNNDQIIMECYNDDTCAVIDIGEGILTKGTWILNLYCQTPRWWVKLDDVFPGFTISVDTNIAKEFAFKFKDASGRIEETLSLPYRNEQIVPQRTYKEDSR